MIDVTEIDTSTTMLGTKVSVPFYITATALGKLAILMVKSFNPRSSKT